MMGSIKNLKLKEDRQIFLKFQRKIVLGVHDDSSYGFIIDSLYNNHSQI